MLDFSRFERMPCDEKYSIRSKDEFVKGLQWSPDGSCLLAATESNRLVLYDSNVTMVDENRYYVNENATTSTSNPESFGGSGLVESLNVSAGESVYDFKWYPYMNSQNPTTSCYITSCRDHPIHLWDAKMGDVRCSYRGFNHLDELEAANSISFNLTGDRIYAGYKSMIR